MRCTLSNTLLCIHLLFLPCLLHTFPLSPTLSIISLGRNCSPAFPPSIALSPSLSLSNSHSLFCLLPFLSPQDHGTFWFWNRSPPPPPAQTTPPATGAINELPEGAHMWCGCDSHVPRDSRYPRLPPFPRVPQPWGPYSHSSQSTGAGARRATSSPRAIRRCLKSCG